MSVETIYRLLMIGAVFQISLMACSTSNSEAPGIREPHPANYVLKHAEAANKNPTGCQLCHGIDYNGIPEISPSCLGCHTSGPPFSVHSIPYIDPADHGTAARISQVACLACHGAPPNHYDGGIVADPDLFNAPAGTCSSVDCHPAARAHPTNWQGPNEDRDLSYTSSHRVISRKTVNESCASCHNTLEPGDGDLPGSPSCFSPSFTNADGITSGCHSGGFNQSPHELPFISEALHGPAASSDIAYCQQCHGQPGTTQFSDGISLIGCAAAGCHLEAGAHPVNWQGTNDPTPTYLSSHLAADNTDTACAVCHNVNADAPGSNPRAPSCFSADFVNSDGSANGCHVGGPGTPHPLPYTEAAIHGPAAKADIPYCQECHGEPGTIRFDGGTADTGCSAVGCHPDAGAHPVRWQGSTDVTPDYVSSHRRSSKQNTACSLCHDFTEGRTAPNSTAPSCFSSDFRNADDVLSGCHPGGFGAPHAIPFTDAALHGPEAKADLTYCQECHATPSDGGPGSNPRFNVPIGSLTNGCEDCHSVLTAHPYPSWMGVIGNSHKTADHFQTACTLCHGVNLLGAAEGGVGKACNECHLASDPLVDLNCTSCHNNPPDDAPLAGSLRPNRSGSHAIHNSLNRVAGQCIACHDGSGTDTAAHFDDNAPANVSILASYLAETGGFSYNSDNASCSGVSCHGGQATESWVNGTINVDTDCRQCHVRGTSQYNSYNSGDHRRHVEEENIFCTVCHDTQKLAVGHFARLDTTGLEQPANQTIQEYLNYVPGAQSCGVSSIGNKGCHEDGVTERW